MTPAREDQPRSRTAELTGLSTSIGATRTANDLLSSRGNVSRRESGLRTFHAEAQRLASELESGAPQAELAARREDFMHAAHTPVLQVGASLPHQSQRNTPQRMHVAVAWLETARRVPHAPTLSATHQRVDDARSARAASEDVVETTQG
ncbi:MAG: hypothetical protein MUC96_06860 [Myxococcaceae bacterium]|jgi:hypothetical protein|nr:hypothetical protein [Myxococcaceae bacterium]